MEIAGLKDKRYYGGKRMEIAGLAVVQQVERGEVGGELQ